MQYSTSVYNTQGCREPDGGRCLNRVPVSRYKSGAAVDAAGVTAWVSAAPAVNVTPMFLDVARAIPDPNNIITSAVSPQREWQRMSAFLLDDAPNYMASKYGAVVPLRDGSVVATQSDTAVPPLAFTIMQNTSACHVAPTFLNVLDSALYATQIPGASIATRNHPLPFTEFQAAYVTGNYGFNVGE